VSDFVKSVKRKRFSTFNFLINNDRNYGREKARNRVKVK